MIVESYEDVIVLSGALRSNFWETIHTAISLLLKRHPTGVIIDCSGLTECTAEGAETFRDAMDFIERNRARTIVAAVPHAVMEVLRSVPEVRSQLPVVGSVEEARRSLDMLAQGETKGRKKHLTSRTDRRFLVCLSGEESDEQLLMVVQELAQTTSAEAVLIYPILVPRDLPLQSPLLEQEEIAAKALEAGRRSLQNAEIKTEIRLERGRDVASAIHGALEEYMVSQVLVALPCNSGQSHDQALKLVSSVLAKVQQSVLFVRGPIR